MVVARAFVGDGHTTTGRVDKGERGKAGCGSASNGNDDGGACFRKKGLEGADVQALAISVVVLALVGDLVAPSISGCGTSNGN